MSSDKQRWKVELECINSEIEEAREREDRANQLVQASSGFERITWRNELSSIRDELQILEKRKVEAESLCY